MVKEASNGNGKVVLFLLLFFFAVIEAWGQIPTMVFSDKLGDVYPGGISPEISRKSTFDMLCQL